METVTQETTSTSAAPASTEVSQDSYISDAFKGFEDYLNGDEKKVDDKAQTPKDDKQQDNKAQTPKNEGNEDGKNPKEKTDEAGTEKKKDPFETAFTNENGEIDLEKLMGVSLDGLEFKGDVPVESIQQEQQPANAKPKWEQEYDAEKSFKENINRSRLGPIESVFNQLSQMQIPDELKGQVEMRNMCLDMLRNEYAKVSQENEKFFKERDEQTSFRRRDEDGRNAREAERAARLPEQAKVNAVAIINKLPGKDINEKATLYNRIMFGPDAGGEMLEDMFQATSPDFAKKSKDEQAKIKMRFVNELQADGKRLQRFFDRAYRYLTASPENMKRIMSQVSRKTESALKSNDLAAQRSPSGEVQRNQQSPGMWDAYLSFPLEGKKTRV